MSAYSSSRVVFILIDGLRPDAISQAACPNLYALMQRSAYSLTARAVMPSITLPCHMSIFHSVPPDRHGILTNTWQPMARPVQGLVEVIAEHDKRAAFFINWEPLRDLARPGSLTHLFFLKNNRDFEQGDARIAQESAYYILNYLPDFSFVYFGSLDEFAHDVGWMSTQYLEQLGRVDNALGELLKSLPDDYTLLLQSDHGGHERHHGTDLDEDMLIPWMVSGPGIRKDYRIARDVNLLDTAPTIACIFGLDSPSSWEGSCIREIFEQ